jgi:hypothetical protein
MKSIIMKITSIGLLTAFAIMTAKAANCYVNQKYTCHAAGSGCNGSGGGNCWFCVCVNPATALVGTCWYEDTAGTYTRAARLETSGLANISYTTITCTYTHTVYDCSGITSSTTNTDGDPFEISYSSGGTCS